MTLEQILLVDNEEGGMSFKQWLLIHKQTGIFTMQKYPKRGEENI